MRFKALMLAAALVAASTPALAADSDEAAVLGSVQRFFDAIARADPAAMQAVVLPGGQLAAVGLTPDGATTYSRFAIEDSLGRLLKPGRNERMWAHQVMRRGPLATVTGPYEFLIDGVTSHCGVEVFTLIKQDGAWRIASLTWTKEPEACAELKAPR